MSVKAPSTPGRRPPTAATPPGSGLTTAAVRAIRALGHGRRDAGRAEQVAEHLAEAIRRGLVGPGERLPAEAALAEQLGVATLTLREALAELRERGLVETRRGRSGGSFVARPSTDALSRSGLAALTVRQLRELGDQRQAALGAAAELAARRASEIEIAALRRRVDRLGAATTPGERRRADGEFGVELAAAAQSPRITQHEANLRAEVGDLVWTLLSDAEHEASVRVRRALVDAVAEGKPEAARRLAHQLVADETELLTQWRIDLYRACATPEHTWSHLADDFERVFAELENMAAEFEASFAARAHSGEPYLLSDIAALRPRVHATLERFRAIAVGTGVVVAPTLLEDAPYWLEWWWQQEGGAPEALRVNLDPDGPDFFDYAANEWYDVPPVPGHFLVNFGGALEALTARLPVRVRAILHRVRQCRPSTATKGDRFSFAAFLNPAATSEAFQVSHDGNGLVSLGSVDAFLRDFNRATWRDDYADFGISKPPEK